MYSASEALSGLGVRPGPIAAHRLSAKLSSLAWSPALAGVVTVGDYDGSVVQACMHLCIGCLGSYAVLGLMLRPCLSMTGAQLLETTSCVYPTELLLAAAADQCGDGSLAH